MCGIAGWYRRGGKPVPQSALVAACDRIRHRGPDDAGYLTDGDFGFGMRRLSIIDVAGGHQPILSPDAALRDRLQRRDLQSSRASARARGELPLPDRP